MHLPANVKGIQLVMLFGSRARRTASSRSDVDVAVLADHALTLDERIALATAVAREYGVTEDQIDVVDLWSASPLLQYQVAQQGTLLWGAQAQFLRFKVLAWKRYPDTERLRRAREHAFAQQYGR